MNFDLDDLNPGTWFYFDDDESKGGVCVRSVSPEEMARIVKVTVKRKPYIKRGKRFVEEIPDTDKQNEMIWDYCLVDWSNINDKHGNPIDCSAENKKKLMGGSPKFLAFVADCLERVVEMDEKDAEDSEKN